MCKPSTPYVHWERCHDVTPEAIVHGATFSIVTHAFLYILLCVLMYFMGIMSNLYTLIRESYIPAKLRTALQAVSRIPLCTKSPTPHVRVTLPDSGARSAYLPYDGGMHAITADITTLRVDAIVNAANSSLLGGGGVDGAIHRAAGRELLAACCKIRREQLPAGLPVGNAVITPGFNLPARFVIHTVGPNRHRGQTDPQLLAQAFENSALVAAQHHVHTIAFPAISAGVYGWDMAQVAHIGVTTLQKFHELDITFALISQEATEIWLAELER